MRTALFLGDCNTFGTPAIQGQAYPEHFAKLCDFNVVNCGHTMCTTREGSAYFGEYYNHRIDLLCIQYGLVDSWLTFKYSPYVLYYPDSRWRKVGRKLSKKFKKLCKRLGLNQLIGVDNVVPLEEYLARIETMIAKAGTSQVVLIETVPNKDTSRNTEIERYNAGLRQIAARHPNCRVLALYDDFAQQQAQHYCDPTHIDISGHQFVAQKLSALLASLESRERNTAGTNI